MKESGKAKVNVQEELNNVKTKKTHKIEDITNEMWSAIIVAREVIMLETAGTEESREMLLHQHNLKFKAKKNETLTFKHHVQLKSKERMVQMNLRRHVIVRTNGIFWQYLLC